MAGLVALVLSLVFIGWRLWAVFRTAQRVQRAKGLGDKLDAAAQHFPQDPIEEAIRQAGSEKAAQRTLTRRTFRTAPGSLLLIVLAVGLLFYISFVRPDLAPSDQLFPGLDEETVVWIKLGLIAFAVYSLIYHMVSTVTIDGSELVTTSPLFQRRYFDLGKLIQIRLRHHGTYVLRFSDGKTARILRYVTGHDEMVRAFNDALAANQEKACRNFPKSRQSAAG